MNPPNYNHEDTTTTGFLGRLSSFLLGILSSFLRKCIFKVLSAGPIPTHVAFIMDGNRRYAKDRNMKLGAGHRVGFLALMSMLKYCYELGVKYVTVYAFSIDNFRRRPEEVQFVMNLMEEKIYELLKGQSIVDHYGLRVHFLGNLKLLYESTRVAAEMAMAATAKNNKVVLFICVAYTSTDEIVHAVEEAYKEKQCRSSAGDELTNGASNNSTTTTESNLDWSIKLADIERHMYMAVGPDPDILVRTSGETRLSNFLLWQTCNCHLYSPGVLWPEISLRHIVWAVLNYQRVHDQLGKKKQKKNA